MFTWSSPQQTYRTSTLFLGWSWLCPRASNHRQDEYTPGFLSLSPLAPGSPKRGRKDPPPCLRGAVSGTLRWCWKPGLLLAQQHAALDVSVCWELPGALSPRSFCSALFFPSGVFISRLLFFVAVCQLLKQGQMEASSSFVIYGPVFRGDFFCLCSKGLRVTALTAVKQSGPGSRLQNHPIILGSITAQSLGCSLARFWSTAVNVLLTSAQTRLAG